MAAIPDAIVNRPPAEGVEVEDGHMHGASGALVPFRTKPGLSARESAG